MASTASTILRLEKMANGEKTGTWGTVTNVNLDILESRLDGTVTLSDTGGTVTLTNVDYTDDQAKKRIVRCTGTLVSNLIIVIPNTSRTYKVVNATAGAFTVTMKTASGSAVAVTQSCSAELYCNGSDLITYATPIVVSSSGAPSSASGATAATVTVSPSGNLAADDVQEALVEIQLEIDALTTTVGNKQAYSQNLFDIAQVALTKGNILGASGSAWAGLSVGTNGLVLRAASGQSSGLQWAGGAPTTTIAPFQQTAAPTGWTKNTTHNDKALRVVSGSASTGGSTAFTTIFTTRTIVAANLPNMTLTVTDPGHTHTIPPGDSGVGSANGGQENHVRLSATDGVSASATTGIGVAIDNTSRGGAQTTMDFAVQYVDIILATCD